MSSHACAAAHSTQARQQRSLREPEINRVQPAGDELGTGGRKPLLTAHAVPCPAGDAEGRIDRPERAPEHDARLFGSGA